MMKLNLLFRSFNKQYLPFFQFKSQQLLQQMNKTDERTLLSRTFELYKNMLQSRKDISQEDVFSVLKLIHVQRKLQGDQTIMTSLKDVITGLDLNKCQEEQIETLVLLCFRFKIQIPTLFNQCLDLIQNKIETLDALQATTLYVGAIQVLNNQKKQEKEFQALQQKLQERIVNSQNELDCYSNILNFSESQEQDKIFLWSVQQFKDRISKANLEQCTNALRAVFIDKQIETNLTQRFLEILKSNEQLQIKDILYLIIKLQKITYLGYQISKELGSALFDRLNVFSDEQLFKDFVPILHFVSKTKSSTQILQRFVGYINKQNQSSIFTQQERKSFNAYQDNEGWYNLKNQALNNLPPKSQVVLILNLLRSSLVDQKIWKILKNYTQSILQNHYFRLNHKQMSSLGEILTDHQWYDFDLMKLFIEKVQLLNDQEVPEVSKLTYEQMAQNLRAFENSKNLPKLVLRGSQIFP